MISTVQWGNGRVMPTRPNTKYGKPPACVDEPSYEGS